MLLRISAWRSSGYSRIYEAMRNPPERILLLKPSSLGDIIHALPTLAAIRRTFPEAHISWLVKKAWAPILHHHPLLDDIIEVEFSAVRLFGLIGSLRARRFDIVVDLQGLLRTGVLSWLSGAATRIGFTDAREGSSLFYTRRIVAPMREMHAVDRYLCLASALGATSSKSEFVLPYRSDEKRRGEALFTKAGLDDASNVIGIAPSARWVTKRWPAESFAAVADQLQYEGPHKVVFIGVTQEKSEVARVKRAMRTEAADLTGLTTVGDLPAVMRRLRLLITNDSGPMHVAAAVGTSVVAVFGPTSSACTGPYGDGHTVLTSPVDCRPCFRRQCHNPNTYECLTRISVQDVVRAAQRVLQRNRGGHNGG
ncbi:MAG TPA: lipopolysaccharide heptosyltransferase II [Nitrospirales bacterium]|nr:lipopolysaccharide heptosyltransferase II [Nitrospirales bacterium]